MIKVLMQHTEGFTFELIRGAISTQTEFLNIHCTIVQDDAELLEKFLQNYDIVTTLSFSFNNNEVLIKEWITKCSSIITQHQLNTRIILTIDDKISHEFIEKIKSLPVCGVVPAIGYASIDLIKTFIEKIRQGEQCWPEDFIAKLPRKKQPRVVVFRENNQRYFIENNISVAKLQKWPFDSIFCRNFQDLSKALYNIPDLLIIHIDSIIDRNNNVSEFMVMVNSLIQFNSLEKIPRVAFIITKNTDMSTIRELQKNGIAGIVPAIGDWGLESCKLAVTELTEFGIYWPKDIISQLPGQVKSRAVIKKNLTGRQQQVFNLIKQRGLSNRQISTVLKISENTVKVHVKHIMKHYKVQNRTQLITSI